jgi:hypothetical protein
LHALRAKPPTYLSQMSLYRLLCACSQIWIPLSALHSLRP